MGAARRGGERCGARARCVGMREGGACAAAPGCGSGVGGSRVRAWTRGDTDSGTARKRGVAWAGLARAAERDTTYRGCGRAGVLVRVGVCGVDGSDGRAAPLCEQLSAPRTVACRCVWGLDRCVCVT